MKLNDQYDDLKNKYPEAIVLIKSGNFYLTFENDATILSYICNYKKKNDKAGFPLISRESVIEKLKDNKLNYFIDNKYYSNDENNYYLLLKKASDDLIASNMVKSLTNIIKEKIIENASNYERIRKYLNEL